MAHTSVREQLIIIDARIGSTLYMHVCVCIGIERGHMDG